MAVTQNSKCVGSHVWFAREGASFSIPSPGTTSKTEKPGGGDAAWKKFGVVNSLKVSPPKGEGIEIWEPSPGQLRRKDVKRVKRDLKYSIGCVEFDQLALELLFGTAADPTTQFNPLAGAALKGWLKFQQYDEEDELLWSVDTYVELSIASDVDFDPAKNTEVSFEALPLHSILNTGSIQ